MARAWSASLRSGRRRIWISAEFFEGNRYAKRDLGMPGAPAVRSNTSADTNAGSLICGTPLIPYFQREPQRVVDELRLHRVGGGLREALLLGARIAAALGEPARRLGGLLRLRGGRLLLLRELVLDLADGRVDERGRPVHDLRGLQLGDLPADRRQAAEPLLVVRDVAAQAALEPQHAVEVRGEHGARELAVHQHEDRLAAEVLLEALRVLEALRAAVHERLRGRARLEPQRERGAAQRKHRGQRRAPAAAAA